MVVLSGGRATAVATLPAEKLAERVGGVLEGWGFFGKSGIIDTTMKSRLRKFAANAKNTIKGIVVTHKSKKKDKESEKDSIQKILTSFVIYFIIGAIIMLLLTNFFKEEIFNLVFR